MPLSDSGQAGDLTNEDITTEMIGAGAAALRELDWDGREMRHGESEAISKMVLEAAFRASGSCIPS